MKLSFRTASRKRELSRSPAPSALSVDPIWEIPSHEERNIIYKSVTCSRGGRSRSIISDPSEVVHQSLDDLIYGNAALPIRDPGIQYPLRFNACESGTIGSHRTRSQLAQAVGISAGVSDGVHQNATAQVFITQSRMTPRSRSFAHHFDNYKAMSQFPRSSRMLRKMDRSGLEALEAPLSARQGRRSTSARISFERKETSKQEVAASPPIDPLRKDEHSPATTIIQDEIQKEASNTVVKTNGVHLHNKSIAPPDISGVGFSPPSSGRSQSSFKGLKNLFRGSQTERSSGFVPKNKQTGKGGSLKTKIGHETG